jgi:DNA-binding response OmpR family regulator
MKKILIIEDDFLTALAYRSCLEREGYEVAVATDGQSGYDQLLEFKPEGLLVDLMLPKTNGVDFVKKVRSANGFEKLPIVAFTNAFVPVMIDRIKAAGANRIFDKGTLTPSLLTTTLRELARN